MTVKELITELQKLDPNRIVIMSKDAEGNGFSPLAELETADCIEYSAFEVELVEDGCSEEGEPAVVLWPNN